MIAKLEWTLRTKLQNKDPTKTSKHNVGNKNDSTTVYSLRQNGQQPRPSGGYI